MIPLPYYCGVALLFFVLGLIIQASRRDLVKMVLGIELMMFAAILLATVFSFHVRNGTTYVDPLGQGIALMLIATGGCLTAFGLSLVLAVYRIYGSLDVHKLRRLRW